jgi:hypothetical protein
MRPCGSRREKKELATGVVQPAVVQVEVGGEWG